MFNAQFINTKLPLHKTRESNYNLIGGVIALPKEYKAPPPVIQDMSSKGKELAKNILQILENINFPSKDPKKDKTRSNVLQNKDDVIQAFVLGKVRQYDKVELADSVQNIRFPFLYKMLNELVHNHNPKFKYTSIQINKGVQTSWHRDRGNRGLSYCLALGNFTGGGLDIKIDGEIKHYDNHNKFLYYDGNYYEHASSPVKSGTRYAIIFYTHH